MKCIIPCAGRGARMGRPLPKALLSVRGKPLLYHIMDAWEGVVDGFIIVSSPAHVKLFSACAPTVVQSEPTGLAQAILQAENFVEDKFIVSLGDCIYRGKFESSQISLGVGAWKTKDVAEMNKSYLVELSFNGRVEKLTEKPNLEKPRGLCGMGTYFLDRRIFDYIRKTFVVPGGGDFTYVLQTMVDAGEQIMPVIFHGNYMNLNCPEDLERAEEMF